MRKTEYPAATTYSKSEINRCGKILRDARNFDEYLEAFDVVSAWRASHLYPLNTFRASLSKQAGGLQNSIIAQRLKRMPTIIAKLRRNSGMELSRMQDVGGLRVIVNNVREVVKLRDYYLSDQFAHEVVRASDYIEHPKKDGYRGIHLVFKYVGSTAVARAYDGLLIELQIRTKLQHTWATAVEVGGILLGQKLKNDEGNRKWLEFFALVSEAFEIIEALDDGERYVKLSRRTSEEVKELYEKITLLDKRLRVLEKISAFSSAMRFLDDAKTAKKQKYFIMEMDPIRKRVKIYGYNRQQYALAVKQYNKLEQKNRDTVIDQVLVSASSLKQLHSAYPNYFANIDDFAAKVRSIEKMSAV